MVNRSACTYRTGYNNITLVLFHSGYDPLLDSVGADYLLPQSLFRECTRPLFQTCQSFWQPTPEHLVQVARFIVTPWGPHALGHQGICGGNNKKNGSTRRVSCCCMALTYWTELLLIGWLCVCNFQWGNAHSCLTQCSNHGVKRTESAWHKTWNLLPAGWCLQI